VKVSILTVSKRLGWEQRAKGQIMRQSLVSAGMHTVEWVVVQEPNKQNRRQRSSSNLRVIWLDAPEKIRRSNLNASLNLGLANCTGDAVIFYQDFIDLPIRCFAKLVDLAGEKTFVTTLTRNADNSTEPRYLGVDLPRPCRPNEWEANVAIAPMGIIREVGGFIEEYDSGWAWDNVSLAERAAMHGCNFVLDESNRPQLLHHPKETDIPINAFRHEEIMRDIRDGRRSIKGDLDAYARLEV
jgi:hypothetical protein